MKQAVQLITILMMRTGDWKWINGLGSGGFTKPSNIKPKPREPAAQLYNLRTDPAKRQILPPNTRRKSRNSSLPCRRTWNVEGAGEDPFLHSIRLENHVQNSGLTT